MAGQPLAANVRRVLDALDLLGRPLDADLTKRLNDAVTAEDAGRLQELLDPHLLCVVTVNPESRIKVERGRADAMLQQAGYIPFLVKVVNQGTVKSRLRLTSPQAGAPYGGVARLSMERQDQTLLRENEVRPGGPRRFLHVEMFMQPPLSATLSGLEVEYAVAVIYSSESGKRDATLGFDVGQGTQDLGFRGEVPVLFDVRPAVPVRISIRDQEGKPSYARLTFRDQAGHVYPPQARRLAPDFFFQKQIYRRDGEVVLLPPGDFRVESSRGPEYRVRRQTVRVRDGDDRPLDIRLERWIDPAKYGFYGGDHHIHGAGCAHYTTPTEGVTPQDMFRQVAGEGLNVGCVLTWGPCYDFQRRFFSPQVNEISEPLTVMKYDLEISGFGSQSLGHVCLLNLRDQTYPGSGGTKEKGWPTWATPVLRWAKTQGAVTGFAHSASGLQINPTAAARRLLTQLDMDKSGQLSPVEAAAGLLPKGFAALDADGDGFLSEAELRGGIDRAADELPNLAVPEMNSVGAMELPVAVAMGACDFISAMDTARVGEWNMWYHVLNCGFPLKASGETDFPCMSSTAVGQGRVYVQLGATERLDFAKWCAGLAAGRSYVSDGYAHVLQFTVDGTAPGDTVRFDAARPVVVNARVAFAPETPEAVAYGTRVPEGGRRLIGDTVTLHGARSDRLVPGGERLIEIVVNGKPVAARHVPADGREHDLEFRVPIDRSS
ncbi:MAG TPA: CehA/McbA family metallohydrolase, partial [Gemmataceae bacterium]|nr:CehA/McbA family metallohydrolase [Gemmataceae bacterium]